MNQRILVLALIVAALAVAAWLYFGRGARGPEEWQGYAEADFVKVGPTQQGLVTALHVQRGDRVVKGAPLFDQDDTMERAAVDQAARLAQQSKDQLANLKSPAKPTEIAQAEANLDDAIAARGKVQVELQRNQTLLTSGAATAMMTRTTMKISDATATRSWRKRRQNSARGERAATSVGPDCAAETSISGSGGMPSRSSASKLLIG